MFYLTNWTFYFHIMLSGNKQRNKQTHKQNKFYCIKVTGRCKNIIYRKQYRVLKAAVQTLLFMIMEEMSSNHCLSLFNNIVGMFFPNADHRVLLYNFMWKVVFKNDLLYLVVWVNYWQEFWILASVIRLKLTMFILRHKLDVDPKRVRLIIFCFTKMAWLIKFKIPKRVLR